MTEPLWTWADLITATGGAAEGEAHGGITGVSIDTRTLQPGDLFVALRGDTQDGHAYVGKAFEKGAAAALVAADFVTPSLGGSSVPSPHRGEGQGEGAMGSPSVPIQPNPLTLSLSPEGRGDDSIKGAHAGPLIRVSDPLRDPVLVALEKLGRAARARLSPDARIIAVTGSAGKTSTKEMLKVCLLSVDPHTHASEKSYNNHWGVPLTLARMPKDTRYGVFEIGMNHAGEIALLSPMVRPHVAIITTVGPVHLGFFTNVEEIADAKAEIFLGLEPGGVAVLNAENAQFQRLRTSAMRANADLKTFGEWDEGEEQKSPDYWYESTGTSSSGETHFDVNFPGGIKRIELAAPGRHQSMNALAAFAALATIGVDTDRALAVLTKFVAAEGRGASKAFAIHGEHIVLVDESYNANPLSMDAALSTMAYRYFTDYSTKRRIAVLGDMRELGDNSSRLHRELKGPIERSDVNLVFACGPFMRELYDLLPETLRGHYAETSTDLIAPLLATIALGDVVMVKGSLGTNMKPIVDALKTHLAGLAAANG